MQHTQCLVWGGFPASCTHIDGRNALWAIWVTARENFKCFHLGHFAVFDNAQNYYGLTTKNKRTCVQNPDEYDCVINTPKLNLQSKKSMWKCTKNLFQNPWKTTNLIYSTFFSTIRKITDSSHAGQEYVLNMKNNSKHSFFRFPLMFLD